MYNSSFVKDKRRQTPSICFNWRSLPILRKPAENWPLGIWALTDCKSQIWPPLSSKCARVPGSIYTHHQVSPVPVEINYIIKKQLSPINRRKVSRWWDGRWASWHFHLLPVWKVFPCLLHTYSWLPNMYFILNVVAPSTNAPYYTVSRRQ